MKIVLYWSYKGIRFDCEFSNKEAMLERLGELLEDGVMIIELEVVA